MRTGAAHGFGRIAFGAGRISLLLATECRPNVGTGEESGVLAEAEKQTGARLSIPLASFSWAL